MRLISDLLQEDGRWSARRIGATTTTLAAPIAGAAMVAVFLFRVVQGDAPSYAEFSGGIVMICGGSGFGAWLHGKAQP